jgi:antitoxin component of MazEF toxin-antitoxin module
VTVTVRKVGGSAAVVIPPAVAREMDLAVGTSLDISTAGGQIVMRKRGRRPRRPLAQLVAQVVAQVRPAAYRKRAREAAERGPVGREVW